jgi:hypothetical protein
MVKYQDYIMLTSEDLKWVCQAHLVEGLQSTCVNESQYIQMKNFICNEMTYEQLLNMCLNESRDEYLHEGYLLDQYLGECIILEAKKKKHIDIDAPYKKDAKSALKAGAGAGAIGAGLYMTGKGAKKAYEYNKVRKAMGMSVADTAKFGYGMSKIPGAKGAAAEVAAKHIGKGLAKGAAAGALAGLTMWGIFRLFRKKGASKAVAASKAAASAKSQQDRAKWNKKAKAYKAKGE